MFWAPGSVLKISNNFVNTNFLIKYEMIKPEIINEITVMSSIIPNFAFCARCITQRSDRSLNRLATV